MSVLNEKILKKYQNLIEEVLFTENVKQIKSTESTCQFFDKVVVNDNGTLSVYKRGLKKPSTHFLYDFSVDYAALLYYFEQDIYDIRNENEPTNGFAYEFNEEV